MCVLRKGIEMWQNFAFVVDIRILRNIHAQGSSAASYNDSSAGRRGVAIFAAILVMIVLSLLAVQFHQVSRQAQATAFRFQCSEMARQLAESAMEEAFFRLNSALAVTSSSEFIWLRDGGTGQRTIPCPLTIEQAEKMNRQVAFEIVATAQQMDFRRGDSSTPSVLYYGKEGVGTLQLTVTVKPKSSTFRGDCTITRHIDYKVVCIVAKASKGAGYTGGFPLDYALLVRDAQTEFRDQRAVSLNHPQVKIVVEQKSIPSMSLRGQVHFGGTNLNGADPNSVAASQRVFLNINNDFAGMIPPFPKTEIHRIDNSAVNLLFPEMKEVKDKGGVFVAQRLPLVPDSETPFEKKTRDAVRIAQDTEFDNIFPGIYPLGDDPAAAADPAHAKAVLRGEVRQRFFYMVYFYLDLSRAYVKVKQGLKTKKVYATAEEIAKAKSPDNWVLCAHLPNPMPQDSTARNLYVQVNALNNSSGKSLLSFFDDRYAYTGGQSGTTITRFTDAELYCFRHTKITAANSTGKSGFRPYANVNLWSLRVNTLDDLRQRGILDDNARKLRLRGIVQVNREALLIGKPGDTLPYEIEGQGVLIVPGVKLNTGLNKAKQDDLCVLVTRGEPIDIDTDQEIHASLIAAGDYLSGYVRAQKPLKLHGSLVVDRLKTQNWDDSGKHRIFYDPKLKPVEDQYQITLSRWISFQRMARAE